MAESNPSGTTPLDQAPLVGRDGLPLPYADAIGELEGILAELDAGSADVDRLAERVRRAADLVRHCRQRLDVVRADVDDVVGDLEPSERPAPDA
jgi:exodeoxyribonuclease VII small subunit